MKNKLHLAASVFTEKGLVRDSNEDNYYLNGEILEAVELEGFSQDAKYPDGEGIFVVCDGMGGDKFGQKASFEVVNSFKECVKTIDRFGNVEHYVKRINKFVSEQNDRIYKMAVHYPDLKGMGTTFAALIIKDQKAVAMNIGDSRVYLYRKTKLLQLTVDHTEAERMVKLGILTREEARNHIKRYILSRYIGLSPLEGKVEAEISAPVEVERGDIFIISSDGLNEIVDDKKISEVLKNITNTNQIGRALMDEAAKSGGKDNVTYMIVKVCAEHDNLEAIFESKAGMIDPNIKEDILKSTGIMSIIEKSKSNELSKDARDKIESKKDVEIVDDKELLQNPESKNSDAFYKLQNNARININNSNSDSSNSNSSNSNSSNSNSSNTSTSNTGKTNNTKNSKELDYRKFGVLFVGIIGLALMSYALTFLFGKLSAYSTRLVAQQTQDIVIPTPVVQKPNTDNGIKLTSNASITGSAVNSDFAGQLSNAGAAMAQTVIITPTAISSPTATNTPVPTPTKRPRPTNKPVSVTISPEGEPVVNEPIATSVNEGTAENASQAASVDGGVSKSTDTKTTTVTPVLTPTSRPTSTPVPPPDLPTT